jgi:hypothetical protein
MTPDDILQRRLENQRIARASFRRAEDVVAWFGAMQAQDYLGSLWAIGQRMLAATEATVEAAESRRAIVRTWPMRGTLHFVAAADVRWMTQLLAPKVIARNAARLKRDVDLHPRVISRCRDVVARALEGGKRLERAQIYQALDARKIRTGASRGLHILWWLANEGTICLAGRQGKQHTFALLDEWIPKSRALEKEAALAELASRYFTSHGPATIRDFMWWAGVTAKDAKAAIDGAGRRLASDVVDGVHYWSGGRRNVRRAHAPRDSTSSVKLLPAYDEFTVGYEDRSLLVEGRESEGFGLLSPVVIIGGRVVGMWKRTIVRNAVRVDTKLNRALTLPEKTALRDAMEKYREFLVLDGQ